MSDGKDPATGRFQPGNTFSAAVKANHTRRTARMRELLAAFCEKTADEVPALWAQVVQQSPKDAMRLWLDSIEYVMPKLSRTEHTGEDGGPVQASVTVTFVKPPTDAS